MKMYSEALKNKIVIMKSHYTKCWSNAIRQSKNKDIVKEIYEATSFFNTSKNESFKNRVLLILEDITEIKYCPYCGNEQKFKGTYIGYCNSYSCNVKFRKQNYPEQYKETLIKTSVSTKQYYEGLSEDEKIERNKKSKESLNNRSESDIKEWKHKISMSNKAQWAELSYTEKISRMAYLERISIEHYGVDNISKSTEVAERKKRTMNARYGVDNPGQLEKTKQINRERIIKNMENGYAVGCLTKYIMHKNSGLLTQGKYEYDFVDTFYKHIKIESGPRLKYTYKDESR
jgi:hypothetical protein